MVREMSTPAVTKRVNAAGKAGMSRGQAAASGDLGGDGAFSGWRRGKPIPLRLRTQPHGNGLGVTIHRDRTSAGPWKVAEVGRNQGGHSGFAGPGVNRSTGETARTKTGRLRKVRAVRARRWNGSTAGKGTWTKAEKAIAEVVPKQFTKEQNAAVAKAFKGG